jgi:protein-disulfide isomerase/uncharacterized coiled-coil protein SlyX
MTQHPTLLLASAALLVSAIGGGIAIHKAHQARDFAASASLARSAAAERHDALAAAVDALRAETAKTRDALSSQVAHLRTEIEEIRAQMRAASAALETARAHSAPPPAEDLGGEIAALRAEVDALRRDTPSGQVLDDAVRRLKETSAQIAALVAAAPEARAAIAGLQERMTALETAPRPPVPTLEQLLQSASPKARQVLGQIGLAATLANPQQVMESISAFVQEQRRLESQGRPVPPALLAETFDPGSGALRAGPPGAPHRVAVMTDHNCPFCRRAVSLVRQLIDRGDVEVVIHETPILSPQSREAALVSVAAARLDPQRALDLYLAVGGHEGRLDGAAMLEKAAGLGFDREALRQEAEREETARTVDRSLALARRLGVSGTPGFVVQDLLIQGLQPEQVMQALARPR